MGYVGAAVRKSLREMSVILMGVIATKIIIHLICANYNLAVEVTMEAFIHYSVAHLLHHVAVTPLSVEDPRLAAGAFRLVGLAVDVRTLTTA